MKRSRPDFQLSVPKGTVVIIARHGETWWNHKKCFALYNGLPTPARTDDDLNSRLSAIGRIQAVVTGLYVRATHRALIGRSSLDYVFHSTSRRSSETWLYMKKYWDECGDLKPVQSSELSEIKHQSDVSQSQDIITIQDIANEAYKLFSHLSEDEQRKHMREFLIQQMLDRGAGEDAIEHAIKSHGTDILRRRKHKDGENYFEKRKNVARFISDFILLLNGKTNTSTFIGTHGRTYIALLQLLEGFSNEEARFMQKAEGPPFPPHVGYSIFQEENGKLVRRGERYNLARCLRYSKSKPRLLDFHAAPDFPLQKFYVSCKTAGVKLNDELTVIPQRNAKGIFTAIDYNTDSSWPPPDTSTEVITDTSLRTIDF